VVGHPDSHPTIIQPAEHALFELRYVVILRDSSFHQSQVMSNFTVTDGFILYTVVKLSLI
jgi:hypothetical protein